MRQSFRRAWMYSAEPEWKSTLNGPLTATTSRMGLFLSPSLTISQMKLQTVCVPQHHEKMEMHGINSCMKALLVLLKNSTDSRRRNPPWYYSLRQVKRWESASVSQNRANHMFSVNMTSRLSMWKIAAGLRTHTCIVLCIDK